MPEDANEKIQAIEEQAIDQRVIPFEGDDLAAAQKSEVANAVNIIVKDSSNKPGQLNHAQIYGALRKHFKVAKYDEIPVTQFEQVIEYLRDLWQRATKGTVPEQKSLF